MAKDGKALRKMGQAGRQKHAQTYETRHEDRYKHDVEIFFTCIHRSYEEADVDTTIDVNV